MRVLVAFAVIGLAGCSGSSRQSPDGGGADTLADVPLGPGAHSFIVTSQVGSAGGASGSFSATQTFTLILAADQRTAIVGMTGTGTAVTVTPSHDGLRLGSFSFPFPQGCGSEIRYTALDVNVDSSGQLFGAGQGYAEVIVGDQGGCFSVTMTVTGTADLAAPGFALDPNPADPFLPVLVAATEPLPPDAHPVLLSTAGDQIPLTPVSPSTFVSLFAAPSSLLPFATTYDLVIDGIVDFAGNAATLPGAHTFTTQAAPPLVPEDGFESAADATLGGAQVLSGAGATTVTGAKSLYIPTASSNPGLHQVQLALRLALSPGDTAVRFTYRSVNVMSEFPGTSYFEVGSVGSQIAVLTLKPDTGTLTATTIGGTQVMLGPVTTTEIALPAGATGEVVFARILNNSSCGLPRYPASGIIIDDLMAVGPPAP